MKKLFIILVGLLIIAAIVVPLFFGESGLLGAGATFPHPLYSKMFDVYDELYRVKINYEGIGSGGGIRQLLANSVDFAGTDVPIVGEGAEGIVHIPIAVGGVAVTYHLPLSQPLKIPRTVVAGIFLGRITRWDDPALREANPGVGLPHIPIVVVYRSDGSGTTALFTRFLSAVSPAWKTGTGSALSVKWPVGVGAKGNAGVTALVKALDGSIGYVELSYALINDLPRAMIENKSGDFVLPSLETTDVCSRADIPEDAVISLVDTDEKTGYPISGFTWIVVYRDLGSRGMSEKRAKELVDLVWWMTHDGQRFCAPLEYAPLTADAQRTAERLIESITYGGKRLR